MENDKKRAVVKIGSSSLEGLGSVRREKMRAYAASVIKLEKDLGIVSDIVTSGARAEGIRRFDQMAQSKLGVTDQVFAATGSAGIVELWQREFEPHKKITAAVFVTHKEINDKREGSVLTQTIRQLHDARVMGIFNANDVLEQDELKKNSYGGDNDHLAVDVGIRTDADILLLGTDRDGFEIDGEVQGIVKASDFEVLKQHLYVVKGSVGTGSMESKLMAAVLAVDAGIETYICNANADYTKVIAGEIGTQVIQ